MGIGSLLTWIRDGICPPVRHSGTVAHSEVTFVPGMCVVWDRSKLTSINKEAVDLAVYLLRREMTDKIIFSCNTDAETRQIEGQLRMKRAQRRGADPQKLELMLQDNSTTHAEVAGLRDKYPNLRSITLIAECWQMPRLRRTVREVFPDTRIEWVSFIAPSHEISREPLYFGIFPKSITWGWRPLWILRNIVFHFITPLLPKKA